MNITDRQLEIIEAAGKIMTDAGVSGLTTKKLAKEMGFSEAALYRHFSSKEDIIVAMLEYVAKMMDERYTISLSKNKTEEQKFILIFQDQFTFWSKSTLRSCGFLRRSFRIKPKDKRNNTENNGSKKVKHLKPVISEGQNKDVFTNVISTDDLLHIIMGSIRLLMYKWRVASFQFDISQKGDELINSLLKLIKS